MHGTKLSTRKLDPPPAAMKKKKVYCFLQVKEKWTMCLGLDGITWKQSQVARTAPWSLGALELGSESLLKRLVEESLWREAQHDSIKSLRPAFCSRKHHASLSERGNRGALRVGHPSLALITSRCVSWEGDNELILR